MARFLCFLEPNSPPISDFESQKSRPVMLFWETFSHPVSNFESPKIWQYYWLDWLPPATTCHWAIVAKHIDYPLPPLATPSPSHLLWVPNNPYSLLQNLCSCHLIAIINHKIKTTLEIKMTFNMLIKLSFLLNDVTLHNVIKKSCCISYSHNINNCVCVSVTLP